MNAHITVIILYYLAFNSDWLFACYFVVILSLVATAVCYSNTLVSVTRRLILMKVKVCYARVSVTDTFSTSESTKTPLFKYKIGKIFWGGGIAPPQTPPPVGRRTRPPHTLLPLGAFGTSWPPKLNVWIRHWVQGHREFPFHTAKFPREVRIFPNIPVIEITTLHHQFSNILLN